MSNTPSTIVGKLIAAVVSIFHKAEPIVDDITNIANKLVNGIKAFKAAHPELVQDIEILIETVIPASTGLINAVKLAFPKAAAVIANVTTEESKTDQEKYQDLINYLTSLKTNDAVLYAGALNTINAWFQQFIASNQGVNLPVSQSLAIAPIVHDPTLGVAA
jgi:Cu2+-containing amine oxidase